MSPSEEPPAAARPPHAPRHHHDPRSQPAECVSAVLRDLAGGAVPDRAAALKHAEDALHVMQVELDRAQRLQARVERDRVRLARARQAYSDLLARHPLVVSWSGQPDGTGEAAVTPPHPFKVGDVVAVVDSSRDIPAATVIETTAERARVRLAGWTLRSH